jgi:hypothetical protein
MNVADQVGDKAAAFGLARSRTTPSSTSMDDHLADDLAADGLVGPASTTGTALIRCWASRAAISLNGVDGSAVTTSVVITSRTTLLVIGILLARLPCLKYAFT